MGRLVSVLFVLLLLPLFLMAGSPLGPKRYYAGIDVLYRDYKEDLELPRKSEEYGTLVGLVTGHDYLCPGRLYYGTELSLVTGAVTYDGSMINLFDFSVRAASGRTRSTIANTEGRVGFTFCWNNSLLITPFIGSGYHYWYRGRVQGVPQDYSERYDWTYLAAGLYWESPIDEEWVGAFRLKLMYPVNPKMDASDLGAKLELGNQLQVDVEFPLTRSLPCKWVCINAARIVPYYRYLPLQSSGIVMGFMEPDSDTHVVGVKVQLMTYH